MYIYYIVYMIYYSYLQEYFYSASICFSTISITSGYSLVKEVITVLDYLNG